MAHLREGIGDLNTQFLQHQRHSDTIFHEHDQVQSIGKLSYNNDPDAFRSVENIAES